MSRHADDLTGNEIAVVGMAGRFPGARTIEEFWRNLRDGVDSIRRLSDDELRTAGVPERSISDPEYVKVAAVLDDMELWDAGFWGFTPLDASIMDPQHRLFLEVSYEALEHAGHAPQQFPGAIGVFAGSGNQAYLAGNLLPNRKLVDSVGFFLLRHTGNDKDFLATRLSYELNLKGPSVNIQTACSTSLVAIHAASQSLLGGECDLALAGGVTIELPHRVGYQYREGEILSRDGSCRAFDAASLGTVFGSGAGVVVLRRLADALKNGDTVYAVVRGSAVNNDGSGKVSYLAPSVDGQAASVVEALGVAGVSADSISYVETHGTGTPLGDPIEVTALTQAFRGGTDRVGFCGLGSVKSNIGHLDTAAGVASFIKAVLAMRHRQLPPSLHFTTPNPAIDFASSPFYVNAALREWTTDGPRRAGVSSLGVGGTNAHVIVEEAPALPATGPARSHQLIVLSAKTRSALDRMSANLADHLVEHPDTDLADAAFTLQAGRQALRERRALVAASNDEARTLLDALDKDKVATATAGDSTSVAFLFAGGGAQYAGMGAELYRGEAVYRQAVDECGIDIVSLTQDDIEKPSVALPALFVTQVAMARLLASWGVRPAACIGHSMGEYTAAFLAGVFSLKDALALVVLRGRLFERVPPGAMLSVPLAEAELRPLLGTELSIAAVNAPALCVASGPVKAIEQLEQQLAGRDVDTRRVRINVAAHSAMLEPILEEFGAFFRTIRLHAPAIPFASNLSGTWITAAEATDPAYWVRHLRSTVRFADGLRELVQQKQRALLEVGPGRVMATLAKQHPDRAASQPVLTSMRHPDEPASDVAFALGALGRLWTEGVRVDWPSFHGGSLRRRIALPTYPFERQRHWVDAPAAGAAVTAEPETGRQGDVGKWFYQPVWHRATVGAPAPVGAPFMGAPSRRRVLLFGGESALSVQIEKDHDVIRVSAGDEYRAGTRHYQIRPGQASDYDKLVAALRAAGPMPGEIVHAWGLNGEAGLANLEQTQERSFFSLLFLAQALGRDDVTDPMRLTVLSSGMQQVAGEEVNAASRAIALGPVRVLPQEYPNLTARSIDVGPTAPGSAREARLLELLSAEIGGSEPGETVAFRGLDRFVQSFEPIRLPVSPSPRLRPQGVYLVTGGLGGLGYSVAEYLAREVTARLVLTGRTASTARHRRQIEALEALGAEVLVAPMDVTDPVQVRRVVDEARRRFGAINGVFHAAGTLDDGLAQMKTAESAARVLAPKVRGTLTLDAALAGPLDCFVLFSSISAIAGLAGQVDYAAANAFLDAFAAERSARDGTYAVSVGWSAWREVGMAARLASGMSPSAAPGDAGHPLLGRRLLATPAEDLFAVSLATTTHWVLDEHRVRGGHALIPGTGFLEIARAAIASRAKDRPIEISGLTFVAPFVVDDGVPRELRVHLQHGAAGDGLVIAGRHVSEDGEEGWEEHVTAQAAYVDVARPEPLDLDAIRRRCASRRQTFTGAEQHPHLAFGPRWSNLKEVCYGDREALARLELPEAFSGDLEQYRLHPSLMDMATAGAEALVPGFDAAGDFYVPMAYNAVRIYAALPRRIMSHIRLVESDFDPREIAVFDVTVTGDDGQVLADIAGFLMARVTDKGKLSGEQRRGRLPRRSGVRLDDPLPVAATPPMLEGLADAISPAEGLDALGRILAGGAAPHTIVASKDLGALIAELRRTPGGAPRGEAPPALPAVAVDGIEAVLATHEAVKHAVVLARANRPGDRKLVAYVVAADDGRATVSDLRRFLKSRLPANLVPSTFVSLDTLPLTAAGAVDRSALPDPFGAEDDYVAPRTDMEKTVAGVWSGVLGIDRVSVFDNFFDIGGHSLLAARVVVRLDKQIGVRLNPAIMVLQTLEQIAAECDKRLRDKGTGPAAPDAPAPDGSPKLATRIFNALTGR